MREVTLVGMGDRRRWCL